MQLRHAAPRNRVAPEPDDVDPSATPLERRARNSIELRLLGGVVLSVDGRTVSLPHKAARVVAFVALAAPHCVERVRTAGVLWPEHSDERASANLRAALWKLKGRCDGLLDVTATTLQLDSAVWLDLEHPIDTWWTDVETAVPARQVPELLPGWYDDWVLYERERVRQNTLHELEASSRAFLEIGAWATAIDLALQAISGEPLRETAHRLVIEAHVGEGNVVEALRHARDYRRLLDEELGIAPSGEFDSLLDATQTRRRRDATSRHSRT